MLDAIGHIGYSRPRSDAILAQLAERVTCNLEVLGSIPRDGSSHWMARSDKKTERFPSGQRGQTVNLLAQPSKVQILLSPLIAAERRLFLNFLLFRLWLHYHGRNLRI